jgi:hypothetical protein
VAATKRDGSTEVGSSNCKYTRCVNSLCFISDGCLVYLHPLFVMFTGYSVTL